MTGDTTCAGKQRRQAARDKGLNGIDFIEVLCPDQRTLCVHLFGKGPHGIEASNVRIEGGRRIRDIRVVKVDIISREDPELEDCLRVTLDKPGDFSTYTLKLVHVKDGKQTSDPLPGFDPVFSHAEFIFKACCTTDLDCKGERICPPEKFSEPEIDYSARDYTGFRQAILDRLALIMPEWRERHVPDLGVALTELLAYTGDYLSYYQDAVATEAYLDTARERISIRRHVKLVDYQMHEGCNARALVFLETDSDLSLKIQDIYFITDFGTLQAPTGSILRPDDMRNVPEGLYEVFEPLVKDSDAELSIRTAHNAIRFYTWGDEECCLPKGSTRATLLDGWKQAPLSPNVPPSQTRLTGQAGQKPPSSGPEIAAQRERRLQLKEGDILILEEILGPETGDPADADPSHRQAVYLTGVVQGEDTLFDPPVPVLEIEWAQEDALKFPLCLSTVLPPPECTRIGDVSLAHGNVIPVDHGRTVEPTEDLGVVGTRSEEGRCRCDGIPDVTYEPDIFYPLLKRTPLTFSQPFDPGPPVSGMLVQDPRQALPGIILTGIPGRSGELTVPEDTRWRWQPRLDLLRSRDQDQHFVVEMDNEGYAHLRFGDGDLGKVPEPGTAFSAMYRIGNGPAGNVGAGKIKYLVLRNTILSGANIKPRNPMPATGGIGPESLEETRLLAPSTFHHRLERAITPEDYAEIAMRNGKVQRAAADLQWTGSWYEAHVALDPKGTSVSGDTLQREVKSELRRYRRMGHDVVVSPAAYLPLDLVLTVCVLPQYLKGDIEEALLERFSNRLLPDGSYGFFHPDNLTFGEGIPVSSIIATAQSVPGVEYLTVTLKRLSDPDSSAISDGILNLGVGEIPQLDNDPSFPEHGSITVILGGGR